MSTETSQEDKFLGIKATISDVDDEEVEVKNVEEEFVAKAKPPESEPLQDDDELSSYSEKVQKRINKMTWEKNEERRKREAAEQMREEAVKYAQQQQQRIRQYENVINTGEAHLIGQIKERANAALEAAKSKYRKAYEEGNTDEVIAAQEEMLNAKAELFSVGQHEQNYAQRQQQWQQWQQAQQWQQQQRRHQPPAPRPPTERAVEWAKENPWFGDSEYPDMTSFAYGMHQKLIANEHVEADSEEYFSAIDAAMHQKFPEYFTGEQASGATSTRRQKSSSVVAPAGRNNGARPRQVKLKPSQLSIAKRLGLTPEQYAKEMMKDMYNG